MDNSLKQIVEEYFSRRYEQDTNAPTLTSFRGIWEETRAETMREKIICENIKHINKIGHIKPKLNIFKIYHYDYSVILAVNDKTKMLWLDDHTSNRDFSQFLEIERLFEKCDEHNSSTIAEIIMRLRFNYVGGSILVGNVNNIPTEVTMKSRQLRREFKQAMSKVKSQITPPRWYQTTSQTVVEFILWTHAWGDLIKFSCTWDGKVFDFTYDVLANSIGDYFPPR